MGKRPRHCQPLSPKPGVSGDFRPLKGSPQPVSRSPQAEANKAPMPPFEGPQPSPERGQLFFPHPLNKEGARGRIKKRGDSLT